MFRTALAKNGRWWAVLALAAACSFQVPLLVGGTDGGASDLGPPPDLLLPDGFIPPSFTPTHVSPTAYEPTAADLVDVTGIDTDGLRMKFGSGAYGPVPQGIKFIIDNNLAVLSIGAWNVNQEIRVIGTRPLVVVAAKAVLISAPIRGEADRSVQGPGGAAAGMGPTPGSAGSTDFFDDGGGGGAGAATAGAEGGDSASGGAGGAGAAGVSTPLGAAFIGGSGGGAGGSASSCDNGRSLGGAGGGAIQISSAISISIDPAGAINVSGGGGRGGCDNGSAGGGGGSGGMILVESPIISVAGKLIANGGGGGGGGEGIFGGNGDDGENGRLSTAQAQGGFGSEIDRDGGKGGALAGLPQKPTGFPTNAGGGGGAYGSIALRSAGTQPSVLMGSVISPAPIVATDLKQPVAPR